MALTKQLTVMLENRRGALAELCSKLAEKAVNILGLMVPDQPGVAPIRLAVDSHDAAKKVLDAMGVKYIEEDVVAVSVSDRPGALGKLTRKLADHNLDVKYCYGSIVKGVGKATIVLAVSDVQAAAKLLK
ncbi:MAG: hypothetical protein LAP13_02620 [Acidobacteriia bacterium]|nr:hypothetical protein [Terriglobia bacterium]